MANAISKDERAAQRYYRMGNEKIGKIVTVLAIPSVVSMLISSIYNMADTFFVSRLGTSASGAVGVTMPLMLAVQAAGMAFGVGAGSFISRLLGQGDKQRANEALATSLYASAIVGIMITVLGQIFLEPLMRIMGSTDTILPFAKSYGAIVLYGSPIMSCSFVLNNSLRAEGNSFLSMIGIGFGAVLNIGLGPLFIFTFHMGIEGAAWALLLCQAISLCILAFQYTAHHSSLSISPKYIRFEGRLFGEIMKIGFPSFLRNFTQTIATILINDAASAYGDSAVAAIGITTRVMMFFFSAMLGYGQGFQPVAGYNFGARLYSRTIKSFWFTFKVMLGWTGICCLFLFAFAPAIVRAFQPGDEALIAIGAVCMRFQAAALPLQSWVLCMNTLQQATGRAWSATFMALLRNGLCFIPMTLLLPPMFGLFGVEIAQAMADLLALIISVPISIFSLRYFNRLQKGLETAIETEENTLVSLDTESSV